MPLQTFLTLIAAVIAAAGLTIAGALWLGINFLWFGLAALVLAALVRKKTW